uniref:Uncharacterized protein n=1 Tax=mine drainage metagenome TaxID=410659 RepID=E6Q0W2_9ZZZZ
MKRFFAIFALAFAPSILHAQSLGGSFSPAFVEGNIRAEDTGKPLVGAKIDVVGAKVSKKGVKEDNGCGAGFAMSAANGSFAVGVGKNNLCISKKHPINGKYYVTVAKRGYLPTTTFIDFAKIRGNEVGPLQLTLTPAHAAIVGQVFVGGKPLPYAFVFVVKNPYGFALHPPKGHIPVLASEIPMIRADGYGKFTIPISPGDYYVLASKAGYQLVTKTVNPLAMQLYDKLAGNPYAGAAMQSRLAPLKAPQLGFAVHVPNFGNAVANLSMMVAVGPRGPEHPALVKPVAFLPIEFRLTGAARSSPNNVLFFTADGPYNADTGRYELSIVRSRVQLGGAKIDPFISHIKTFNMLLYGMPSRVGCRHKPGHIGSDSCGNAILSFTDETATPGRLYYYYIEEGSPNFIGPNGQVRFMKVGAPYSNGAPIVTH